MRNADGDGRRPLAVLFSRRLSPTQRRLARYVIDRPDEAPFLSSVELARRVGVSQPSVTRLANALGYRGYADFQRDLRRLILCPADGAADAGNKFQNAVAAEIGNLDALAADLSDADPIVELGRHFAASEPLCVLGLRASAPLAAYFGYFAAKIHPDVRMLTDGGSAAPDRLAQARHAGGEWLLCFSMPRHPRETIEALAYARELGFRIATIASDPPAAAIDASDEVLTVAVGTRLVFDSHAAAMTLAGALLESLSDAAPEKAQARLEAFERRAARLKWFVAS
ncbi:MAG TPA: MurR/RpiR family transcriptional regulator [Thermomicrobiales bacterium]|nr:MurR/RpiR family transcriptional regulator [Thermomicrobiales bacterium]